MTEPEIRVLPLGTARFDRDTIQLLDASGNQIALPYRTMAILLALVDHADEAVGKDALISAAGGAATVTDEDLVAAIAELRRAIGDQAQNIIQTVPMVGYRLNTAQTDHRSSKGNKLKYFGLAVALLPIMLILVSLLSGMLG